MALQGRERSGEGVHVDTSMHDVGAAFLMRPLTLFEFTGVAPTRGSDAHSPVGAFPAGDGRWVSTDPTQQMWERTCAVIAETISCPIRELLTNEGRAAAMGTRIMPALEQWAESMDAAARPRPAGGRPACGGRVHDEQVRHDPRLASRGLFVDVGQGKDEIRSLGCRSSSMGRGPTSSRSPDSANTPTRSFEAQCGEGRPPSVRWLRHRFAEVHGRELSGGKLLNLRTAMRVRQRQRARQTN